MNILYYYVDAAAAKRVATTRTGKRGDLKRSAPSAHTQQHQQQQKTFNNECVNNYTLSRNFQHTHTHTDTQALTGPKLKENSELAKESTAHER